jgi:hypothetical protein
VKVGVASFSSAAIVPRRCALADLTRST